MNQEINQVVQAVTTMMVLSMGMGMVKPIMLQEKTLSYVEAMQKAREWSAANRSTSVYAASAYAYITAMPLAKSEAKQMGLAEKEGEKTQLLYVLSNLGPWRGPDARAAKVTIKKRVRELGGKI